MKTSLLIVIFSIYFNVSFSQALVDSTQLKQLKEVFIKAWMRKDIDYEKNNINGQLRSTL